MSYFGITEEEIRSKLGEIRTETKLEIPTLRTLLTGREHQKNVQSNCNMCGNSGRWTLYRCCQNNNNARLYICESCLKSTKPTNENGRCWNCNRAALLYGKMNTAFCYPHTQLHHKNNAGYQDERLDLIDKIQKKLIPSKRTSNSKAKKAQPYIDSGLAEPFAMAIVEGTDDDEVLNLWEADWWKQYPAEDMLIVSVLSGQHTESDGKYMNSIRSNHERLSLCCVVKDVTIDWARALLESGFDDYPEAVNSVLDSGEPRIVARIRKMKVNSDTLPTGLGKSVSTLDKLRPGADDELEDEDEEIDDSDED